MNATFHIKNMRLVEDRFMIITNSDRMKYHIFFCKHKIEYDGV